MEWGSTSSGVSARLGNYDKNLNHSYLNDFQTLILKYNLLDLKH